MARIISLLLGLLGLSGGCTFAAAHPHLLLTTEKLHSLRAASQTTHHFLWERYLQDLPRMKATARGEEPVRDARYQGDLIPELAFAWLMTGDRDNLELARKQLLKLTDVSQWASEEDLIYLVPSHFLFGIAIGYDWLYPELSEAERKRVAGFLGRQAEKLFHSIRAERIWWRNQYFQNHSYSNTCGLAFAAAALAGEDPRSEQWRAYADQFFTRVFAVMPADGGSLEGYAYAGYGGEYLLKYTLLAREVYGKDYTGTPWMRNYASYMVQGLLPVRTADEWAMTYGDAPRRATTSTAQHLFVLAGFYRDPVAQRMARITIQLKPRGLGSHGWMMLLYYDPTVGEADLATLPTFKFFPEIGQTMMRSSWTDPDAMLVGFKCGPFMGMTLSPKAVFDFGTGHAATDAGSFQIFAEGKYWAIHPLYPGYKLTEDYNTLLFKGVGQLGEQPGFGAAEALYFKHYPQIVYTESASGYDYVVGDVTRAYHPALGLQRFVRHLLFVKPDMLLVADEVALKPQGMVYNYPSEELKTAGGLTHAPSGYVVGPEGEAFTAFQGPAGRYRLSAVYLDNQPEAGSYSLEVDGQAVHRWKSKNEDVDDHLIAVSPAVELKPGSRIAFRGRPMARECRLVKLTAFSSSVEVPMKVQWLMQVDPRAQAVAHGNRHEITMDDATLDLYPLLPGQSAAAWSLHSIQKPQEPFTFRQTRRLVLEPAFDGESVTLLNLIHTRKAAQAGLTDTGASNSGNTIEAHWTRGTQRFSLTWDLLRKKVGLVPLRHGAGAIAAQ
jgi:hypothetical protein